METTKLVAWLADPADFAAGAALYAEAGGGGVYGQLFALGGTSYSRQVLERELRKLADLQDVGPGPRTVPLPTRNTVMVLLSGPVDEVPNLSMDYLQRQRGRLSAREFEQAILSEPPPEHDPTALADVRARLKACRDERSHLHAQLTTPRLSKVIRNTMAHRILALTEQVQQLLADEAHLLAHGRLPGPLATDDVADAGELRRRLSNAISRRAKLRQRPDRASELPALESEIILIREKLNP